MASFTKVFNDLLCEFIEEIQTVFPMDADIAAAKTYVDKIRPLNPKLIPAVWKEHITSKYQKQIENGDIEFFLSKNYADDIQMDNAKEMLSIIDRLREPIRNMSNDDKINAFGYIQNLTELTKYI